MSLDSSLRNAFKGFDPNDLQLNTAGNWPPGVKFIAYVLVFAIIIAAGVYLFISDEDAELNSEVRQESQLKSQFENEAFRVANLDALRAQMQTVQLKFQELLRQLPTDKEVPGLVDDITKIARNAGLHIESIELQPEHKAEYYVELPISINVRGTYHQMGAFISGVAAIRRIVTLHDYTLTPTDGGQLSMKISAKTYRYDDEK